MGDKRVRIWLLLLTLLVGLLALQQWRPVEVRAAGTTMAPVSVSADKNGASAWVAHGDKLYYYVWDGGHRLMLKGTATLGLSTP
ncbi:hypothetical protein [Chthonomonas calidirosea]|uniref:hypothetical protein n=1 Tax=Chthonomonas calidirosea TaxID=454171 RepID=UPI0006EC6922|nr:hypothetical protein [Chthonomonas calidirosea]CEK20388.1 hypothetical protein CP488_02840 [Chthonomonas calidirosea]